ncbi:MAG: hypothetical protein H6736_14835 [Alphaproteobacteria bacterium]|nr:hypothetical protein [Alphaproteobacteria bacterium]
MVELIAPILLTVGEPFTFAFRADTRVAGRLRLTSGTDALVFTLEAQGREPATADTHRIRGKEGSFVIRDWGEHPSGTELVLRFEGRKLWLKVA